MNNFKANPDNVINEMLSNIGYNSLDDLYSSVPLSAKVDGLNLPDGLNEIEARKQITALAKQNNTDYISFIGGGAYNRFIPASVSQVSGRFEFNTAYTPYQPEISQGTLQMIYEFQSFICELTGMDVSNASVYDAGNACAEAMLMATRITKKQKILVSNALNPEYIEVVKTYANAADIKVDFVETKGCETDFDSVLNKLQTNEYAAFLIQVPNYFGEIENMQQLLLLKEKSQSLLITCVEPLSLIALKKPVEYGADIVVGDVQSFGNPLSFGGPYAGFIACIDKYKRQLAGRIVGRTIDAENNQAFTLTLQAREQHIRREKATSNICSNQGLSVLNATVYMSVMGKNGMTQAAFLSAKNAHILSEELQKKGYKTENKNFFNEFVIEVPNADKFFEEMKQKGILAGIKSDKNKILVCATEMNTLEDIQQYIQNVPVSDKEICNAVR